MPFIFNNAQAYVLELTPGKIRFFRDGGYLAGKDLQTPWMNNLGEIFYCQSADVMYLACQDHPPYKLTRPGADTFSLAAVSFAGKPAEWTDRNWPSVVAFHQQRLWLSGTRNQAQTLWASKTGDFENFTSGTDDDAAMVISLVAEQVNAVHWMLSQKNLLIGTAGGEWVISSSSGQAITSKTIQATRNSNYGTARVRPIIVGSSLLHVSADRRRLRDLSYAFADDAFISQDISLMAEHLTRGGITEMADCQNPDSIIWCRLQNGGISGVTYLRAQEVAGWHRHETSGRVLSIVCIPSDGFTETWLAVQRQNGVFIERMKAPWDGESTNETGCWYVDSGLMYEGSLVQRIYGLGHLEGQEVLVLADGAAHENRIVRNGQIELDWPARRVLVGLPYRWALSPMRLEGLSSAGTTQGKRTRISKVMARLYKSLGVHWALSGQSALPYPLATRDVEMPMDAAPAPFTGDADMPMPGGWTSDARVILSGNNAFPATVIMLAPTARVNE